MRAVLLASQGAGPAAVGLGEIDEKLCGPDQLVVEVRAASVNRADLAQREGSHDPAMPTCTPVVAGLDFAGRIVETGAMVSDFRHGDRVMGIVTGAMAERVVVDHRMVMPVPKNWSYVEGAAASLGFLTAHNALVTAGRMTRGDVVLVHAAGSGVGMQVIQLARYLGASRVLGTSRSNRSYQSLREVGADHVINACYEPFDEWVTAVTDGHGADVIVDLVGGPYLAANVRAAALGARIVGVGRLGGTEGTLDMETLAYKRVEVVGVTFRTRTPDMKADVVARLRRDVPAFTSARPPSEAPESLRPRVAKVLDWSAISEAHSMMAENRSRGKLVLEVG